MTIPAGRSTEATFTLSKATAVPEGSAGVDRMLYRLLMTGLDGTGHYRAGDVRVSAKVAAARRAPAALRVFETSQAIVAS